MRVGQGFDLHRLGEGRELVLGGVKIPFNKGVIAHSDGDVVIHSLCDAILGALGQGDIGQHFPDTDPQWKGADSSQFLQRCREMMRSCGFQCVNVDITIILQEPALSGYYEEIREKIAAIIEINMGAVNIKATTTEKLGPIGHSEAIAALAVVLLEHA